MNNKNAHFDHAPGADLDYGFDWRANGWLDIDETIQTSTWTVQPNSLLLSREQISQNAVTSVFAAGGLVGRQYLLTNTIATSKGRVDNRTILLNCRAR